MTTIEHRTTAGSPSGEVVADPWRRPTAIAAVGVSVLSAAIIAIAGEVIPPLVVMAVLYLAGAVLVARGDARWPRYVLATFGVVALIGNAPFIVADLAHPESIAGFAPQLLLTVAVLVTAIGAVASARRASLPVGPVLGIAAGVVLVGLIGSAVASTSLSDDDAEPGDVDVVAEDVEYPAEITVDAGAVGFLIENEDPFRHTFLIEGTDVDQELPGSTARRVEVDLEPGTYRYYCDVPGHDDMEGELVVR